MFALRLRSESRQALEGKQHHLNSDQLSSVSG